MLHGFVRQTVQVAAESLFEAAALALHMQTNTRRLWHRGRSIRRYDVRAFPTSWGRGIQCHSLTKNSGDFCETKQQHRTHQSRRVGHMRLKLYLYLVLLSIIVIVERPWIGVALIAAI